MWHGHPGSVFMGWKPMPQLGAGSARDSRVGRPRHVEIASQFYELLAMTCNDNNNVSFFYL